VKVCIYKMKKVRRDNQRILLTYWKRIIVNRRTLCINYSVNKNLYVVNGHKKWLTYNIKDPLGHLMSIHYKPR
jgi:hypothetical protein